MGDELIKAARIIRNFHHFDVLDLFLREMKRSAIAVTDESDILKITPLGAGQEVGRSCILLEYKGKKIMVADLF